VLELFTACLLLCAPVAGDSVVINVALADNTTPQVVAVDSVEFYIEITAIGQTSIRKQKVAKQAGTTTARFAYALSVWSVGQTRSGLVGARLGNAAGWSDWTFTGANSWSYTRSGPPAAPESGKVTVESVELN